MKDSDHIVVKHVSNGNHFHKKTELISKAYSCMSHFLYYAYLKQQYSELILLRSKSYKYFSFVILTCM